MVFTSSCTKSGSKDFDGSTSKEKKNKSLVRKIIPGGACFVWFFSFCEVLLLKDISHDHSLKCGSRKAVVCPQPNPLVLMHITAGHFFSQNSNLSVPAPADLTGESTLSLLLNIYLVNGGRPLSSVTGVGRGSLGAQSRST